MGSQRVGHDLATKLNCTEHPALKGVRGLALIVKLGATVSGDFTMLLFLLLLLLLFLLVAWLHIFLFICSSSFPQVLLFLLYNFVDQEDFRNMDYSRITYTLKEDIFQQLSNFSMHMRITWGAH